jgi:hypothetical protein
MSACWLDLDAEAVVPALLELQFDSFLDDISEGTQSFFVFHRSFSIQICPA